MPLWVSMVHSLLLNLTLPHPVLPCSRPRRRHALILSCCIPPSCPPKQQQLSLVGLGLGFVLEFRVRFNDRLWLGLVFGLGLGSSIGRW